MIRNSICLPAPAIITAKGTFIKMDMPHFLTLLLFIWCVRFVREQSSHYYSQLFTGLFELMVRPTWLHDACELLSSKSFIRHMTISANATKTLLLSSCRHEFFYAKLTTKHLHDSKCQAAVQLWSLSTISFILISFRTMYVTLWVICF